MLAAITEIQWHDPLVAVPAFLTLVLIPLHLFHRQRPGLRHHRLGGSALVRGKGPAPGLAALLARRAFPGAVHLSRRELVLVPCWSSSRGSRHALVHLVAYFFGGAFLANSVPHLINGISGRAFQSPFAKPPGEGLSSSTVNVLWGFFNLAVAYVLLVRVGSSASITPGRWSTVGAGILLMSIMLARAFGRFHGGLLESLAAITGRWFSAFAYPHRQKVVNPIPFVPCTMSGRFVTLAKMRAMRDECGTGGWRMLAAVEPAPIGRCGPDFTGAGIFALSLRKRGHLHAAQPGPLYRRLLHRSRRQCGRRRPASGRQRRPGNHHSLRHGARQQRRTHPDHRSHRRRRHW